MLSARAGSGIVIARLPDGCTLLQGTRSPSLIYLASPAWSAPSAIGTAGLGLGVRPSESHLDGPPSNLDISGPTRR